MTSKVYFSVYEGRAYVIHASGDMAAFLADDDHGIYGFGVDDQFDLVSGVYVATGEPKTTYSNDNMDPPEFEYEPEIRPITRDEWCSLLQHIKHSKMHKD